ncbi:MAG: Nif3-like dinuclear metal center hexameric protein [Tissierella sp.]|nr:Nif3-like dinuclear metal center hexameric protein [Tissierella sp.]
MIANDIIKILEKWVPKKLIDSWDNTGFQIGNPDIEVSKILIALDLDEDVLNKAIEEKFQMIITHHPIIFKPLKNLTTMDYTGNIISQVIKNDIVVYNAHSNLDLAEGGVNDKLAEVLGLKDTSPVTIVTKEDFPENKIGYGRVGFVDRIELNKYLDIIKANLDASHLIVYGDKKDDIEKVAVCGGSGSDFIKDAYKQGADIYITGDIKYHDAELGYQLGLTIVDAGHFNTEKIILPTIKDYLEKNLNNKIEIEVLMESSVPQFIY